MFWSGNFIVVRELNSLLKEENVTLSQVLEADDILQECKADNKALMQFLTRPDILAELITLITEEPPANVELAQQYRHASIACEVLTSPLSSLSDRLSMDTAQMNRLCDFLNRDPPLNPLLASYFSKTIEMLLERNPKQDWYLYHIVCLRVLDFFKSRRDFLPNLLRHMSTSAIADTFKFFIRLDDLFNKIVMEWLEEHQFIECLIQIVCGSYVCEGGAGGARGAGGSPEEPEKGQREPSEKHNHSDAPHTHDTDTGSHDHENNECPAEDPLVVSRRRQRISVVAAGNAAELLVELVGTGCAGEGAPIRSRTSWALLDKLAQGNGPRHLLQAVFTCGVRSRATALTHGTRLLRKLVEHAQIVCEGGTARAGVELAVAPHLPLLHQALLRDPATYAQEERGGEGGEGAGGAVGAARIQTAALLAHLASSEVEEVATTMLTLGTPGVLVDMFFRYPHNNFLHATLVGFVRNALANPAYRTQYTTHLLVECDLLTRLMDAYEENENKQRGCPRAGYMGHATLLLSRLQCALEEQGEALPAALAPRWHPFAATKLDAALQHFNQPLGGTYPSENSYEVDNSSSGDRLTYYDGTGAEGCAGGGEVDPDRGVMDDEEDHQYREAAKDRFLELADQRFDDDMWDDAPEAEAEAEEEEEEAPPHLRALRDVLAEGSPWDSGASGGAVGEAPGGEDGWAQFEALSGALPPADPFADTFQGGFPHYWPYEGGSAPEVELCDMGGMGGGGGAALASHLLTAMSGMSPAAIANLVNANLHLQHLPPDGEGTGAPPGGAICLEQAMPTGAPPGGATCLEQAMPTGVPPGGATCLEQAMPVPPDTTQEPPSEKQDIPPPKENEETKTAPDTEQVKVPDVRVTAGRVAATSDAVPAGRESAPTFVRAHEHAVTPTKLTHSVSTDSPQKVANLPNKESNEPELVSPVPTPPQSPSQEFPGDSPLVPGSKHLTDVTEKLNDICLGEQKAESPPPATPPADSASENIEENAER